MKINQINQTGIYTNYNIKRNNTQEKTAEQKAKDNYSNSTQLSGVYYMPAINFRGKSDIDKYLVCAKDENGKEIQNKWGNPVLKLDPEIKKAMDKETFEFIGPDGEKFTGTVKDALQAYIRDTKDIKRSNCYGLYHGSSLEGIKQIKENGPDPRKTTSVGFGPGMYFALSEGDAHDYSSKKIKANLQEYKRRDGETGKFALFNGLFYKNITTPEVEEKLSNLTNLDGESDIKTLLNDYCREILVDDLKIDAGYGYARSHHPCIIVFNPDVISNIRNSNEY